MLASTTVSDVREITLKAFGLLYSKTYPLAGALDSIMVIRWLKNKLSFPLGFRITTGLVSCFLKNNSS
ncbi:unnamed protein product [Sphenostylis stenocarpa]|uniref:Uncharacterized protein n=1 Tax=Sphenostylis stenocarpa TaxID=92480 RepID=A0AA86VL99_9FABA|nr:unnamed protein product [Sphenostylis stenocarpa]